MLMESMYQEIILNHYRNPHATPYDAEAHQVTQTRGDEITLRVTLQDAGDEPVVEDVSYDARGCSIGQGSASVMSDLVIGKPVSEGC